MLCDWLQDQGHHCDTALIADMPHAHEEVGRFILKHRPDVVIYDIGMPYASSWDLLEVIRTTPALQSQPFVITTPNKRKLEQAVGPTPALEIGEPRGRLASGLQSCRNSSVCIAEEHLT